MVPPLPYLVRGVVFQLFHHPQLTFIFFRIVGGELESVGANALMALWMKSQMVNGHAKWTIANYNVCFSSSAKVLNCD